MRWRLWTNKDEARLHALEHRLDDARVEEANLRHQLKTSTMELESRCARLSKQNRDLYAAFRSKMDRKRKHKYYARVELELIALQAEYGRLLKEYMGVFKKDEEIE